MAHVVMYCTATCPFCQSAERLLNDKGVRDIEKIRVDLEPERREEMTQKSGRRTVPQIWIGDAHVGGCDELYALDYCSRIQPCPSGLLRWSSVHSSV